MFFVDQYRNHNSLFHGNMIEKDETFAYNVTLSNLHQIHKQYYYYQCVKKSIKIYIRVNHIPNYLKIILAMNKNSKNNVSNIKQEYKKGERLNVKNRQFLLLCKLFSTKTYANHYIFWFFGTYCWDKFYVF